MNRIASDSATGTSPDSAAKPSPNSAIGFAPGLGAVLLMAACSLLTACSEEADPAPPPPPSPADTDTPDRAVLVAFYTAAGGAGWANNANWNAAASSISNWYGVETDSEGYVTELDLTDNGLAGTITPQLGNLSRLRRLDLAYNDLAGSIPPELGNLVQLDVLDLVSNSLTGSIPASLGSLAQLDTLDLNRNELTGPIPPELGQLSSLRRLGLALNRLSGTIPPELGNLTTLRYMSVGRNELTGTIPPELGNLEWATVVSVSRNQLTGTIPPELGGLARVDGLYLYSNALTGPIPPELGSLSRLEILRIYDNQLTGAIPAELGDLSRLEDLQAQTNQLGGALPASLGKLAALGRLDLRSNRLAGGLPEEISGMEALRLLLLDENPELSGLLPRSLTRMEQLANLSFADTGLCPQVDPDFRAWLEGVPGGERPECDEATVERLALDKVYETAGGDGWRNRGGWGGDAAAGRHGVTVGAAGRVSALDLADNGLVGPLAPELANLSHMERIDVSGNDLEGGLPAELALLPRLSELRLDGNAGLAGPIPFVMRRLERMRTLTFAGTGMCASPSSSFQSWLGGIAATEGATCENPGSVKAAIPVAYMTQAVQDRDRNVQLVAGRDALLRVFVTAEEPRGFYEPTVVATVSLFGQETHRAVLTRDDDQIPAEVVEGDLAMSYNTVIPGSAIVPGATMVAELDPDGDVPFTDDTQRRFPALAPASLNAVEVPPMELTIVPVFEAAEPDSSILGWTDGIDADSPQVGLLRHAFPFERFSAATRDPLLTSLDLTNQDDQWRMVLELEAARTAQGGTGYWYGVALSVNGYVRGRARISGWASLGKPWATELAHEVGHNLSLSHAPCGNPPGPDPAYPHSNGSIGAWGYDFRDGSLVSPRFRRDIMGYCYEQGWLSDYHTGRVIEYREQTEGGPAQSLGGLAHAEGGPGPGGKAEGGPARRARTTSRPSGVDVLVLWGGVLNGQPLIEPVFAMRGAPVLPASPGPYRLRAEDAAGRAIFALDFEAGEDKFGDRYFFFAVPLQAAWDGVLERVTLVAPEGTVTVDGDDQRTITVVSERASGQLRAILRGEEAAAAGAAAAASGIRAAMGSSRDDALRIVTTRGPREASRGLRR